MSRYTLQPSHDFLQALEECVSVTEACVSTLGSGLVRLEPGTRDLPRLTKVLRNEHRFLLLPSTTIQDHLSNLSTQFAPKIDALIARAEMLIEGEQTKVKNLEERASLLQVNLNLNSKSTSHTDAHPGEEVEAEEGFGFGNKLEHVDLGSLSVLQKRKIAALRSRRERLEKERAKLGL